MTPFYNGLPINTKKRMQSTLLLLLSTFIAIYLMLDSVLYFDIDPTDHSTPSIILPEDWEDVDHIEQDIDSHDANRYIRWMKNGAPPMVLPLRREVLLPPEPTKKNVTVRPTYAPLMYRQLVRKNLTDKEREDKARLKFERLRRRKCVPHLRFDEQAHRLRLHVFVVHHGGVSYYIAKSFQYCREDWVTLVQLPKTPFFESGLTLSHFSDDRLAQMEQDYDYFFIAGYKVLFYDVNTIDHAVYRYVTEEMLEHMVLYARSTKTSCEVMAYHDDTSTPSTIEDSIRRHHPNATWNATLAVLNTLLQFSDRDEGEEKHQTVNRIRVFMRNTYMIKSTSLRAFARTTRSVLNHIRRSAVTLDQLETDAAYLGAAPRVAMHMFNQSYYMQHPFVFERMTSVFMMAAGLEVCYRFASDCYMEFQGGPPTTEKNQSTVLSLNNETNIRAKKEQSNNGSTFVFNKSNGVR